MDDAEEHTETASAQRFVQPTYHEVTNVNQRSPKRRKLRHEHDEHPVSSAPTQPLLPQTKLSIGRIGSRDGTLTLRHLTDLSRHTKRYVYANKPPTIADLQDTIADYDIPSKIYLNPYYSNEDDAPERPREYAGLVFDLKGGSGLDLLSDWVDDSDHQHLSHDSDEIWSLDTAYSGGWEYASCPPSYRQVVQWLKAQTLAQQSSSAAGIKRPSQVRNTNITSVAVFYGNCIRRSKALLNTTNMV